MFLIAFKTRCAFTDFYLSTGPDSWESVLTINSATKFDSKIRAIGRAKDAERYLNWDTNFVGDVTVVTERIAKKIYKEERLERITPEKLHARWCQSYHIGERRECRFMRDIRSLVDLIKK